MDPDKIETSSPFIRCQKYCLYILNIIMKWKMDTIESKTVESFELQWSVNCCERSLPLAWNVDFRKKCTIFNLTSI